MKLYYNAGFGNYVFALIALLWEPDQSKLDISITFSHHVATIILISGSYIYSFHRFGAIVLCLHDVSDPFMEMAKMFLYAGYTKIADGLFALFAVVFILTRNVFFPFFVLPSINKYAQHPDGSMLADHPFNFWVFVAPLWFLEALHIYWASLIVRMAVKAIRSGQVEDDVRNKKVE